MRIILGKNPGLKVGYRCSGCNNWLEISVDTLEIKDHLKAIDATAKEQGWLRREFYPEINPWFCSKECSLESPDAKYLEQYWKNYKNEHRP